MNEEMFAQLDGQDRIDLVKGRLFDEYKMHVSTTLDSVIPDGSYDTRLESAFRQRVEAYIASPNTLWSGDELTDLTKGKEERITPFVYNKLRAAAAGLAGKLLSDSGFPEFAEPVMEIYKEGKILLD